MSDVTVAPNATPSVSSAPSAPATHEVPVETTHATTPTPLGPQTPNKPVGDIQGSPHRPQSRREVIAEAFAKSREHITAREAKMGDNNPPEPMRRERPKPKADPEKPSIDLRKRPDEQPKPSDERPRGEHGHFASRDAHDAPKQEHLSRENATGTQQQPEQTYAPGLQHRQPLPRMTERARAEWASVPESVQQDVHRMNNEFAHAYQVFRADHEAMNSLRPYQRMAQQQGTTLANVVSGYHGYEHLLRNDPIGGFHKVMDNLNLQADGRKITALDVAWAIVNQTPEQRSLVEAKALASRQAHQLEQQRREIAALANQQKQMQYAAAFQRTRAGVDQYATTHTRLDELHDVIKAEIGLGFDLDTAYQRANLLRPATTAPQTRNGTTAAQTRNTTTAQTRTSDRSISGAPGGSSNGTGTRPHKPVERRDAIANAIKHVNGSL
jgi:hypothetical protein